MIELIKSIESTCKKAKSNDVARRDEPSRGTLANRWRRAWWAGKHCA